VRREYGKMGKSLKNIVTPDDMYEAYGGGDLLDLVGGHVLAASIGVGVGLDVALVEEAVVGLGGGDVAQVEQDLVPEARVEQVQDGVLDAADVQVGAAGGVAGLGARRHAGGRPHR